MLYSFNWFSFDQCALILTIDTVVGHKFYLESLNFNQNDSLSVNKEIDICKFLSGVKSLSVGTEKDCRIVHRKILSLTFLLRPRKHLTVPAICFCVIDASRNRGLEKGLG